MVPLLAVKAPTSGAENSPAQPASPARQILADAQRHFAAHPEQATVWATRELDSLAHEKDEELLASGLLHIAGRLKGRKKLEASVYLYGRLAESEIPAGQRQKAAAELGAITGSGPFGQRAEFLFSRFQQDSSDYRLIAPMLGATFLGQLAGSAALGRLLAPAAQGSGGLFGSAWMARAGAASTGYLAEVSAFTVLGRAFAPQAHGTWGEDFARGALTVGVLKLAGATGQGLGKQLTSPYAPLNRISQTVLPQATALTGLMAAHRLEEHVGLRPHVEGQNLFFESLATLAALTVGARLGRGALGEGFHQTQTELNFRARQLSNTPRWPELFRPRPALALAGGAPGSFAPASDPRLGQVWAMAMNGNGNGSGGGKRAGTYAVDPISEGSGVPARIRQSGFSKDGRPETLDPADVLDHNSLSPESSTPVAATVEVQDPYIGQVIGGRYRIDAVLGEGGMGKVYRGENPALERPVAIKILKTEAVDHPEVVHRFLSEAKVVQRIKHPHIIDVEDFGKLENGAYYLVMEFLKGKELSTLVNLDNQKTEPIQRILPIFRQIAEGLSAAHQAGIVHRDLKPENIFLIKFGSQKDHVKILDFGIAKVQTAGSARLTQEGQAFGTPMYMSPEQVKGESIDHRSDIYSYGAVLYEMTTGRMLWDYAKTIPEIYTLHLSNDPIPPREAVANPEQISPGLQAIILKCLQKNPDHRYQSMEALIADLDLVQRNLTPQASQDIAVRKPTAHPAPGRSSPYPPINGQSAQPTGSRHEQTMYIPRNKALPKLALGGGAALAAVGLGTATYFLLRKDDSSSNGVGAPPVAPTAPVQTPQVTPITPDAPPAPQKIRVLLSVEPADAKIFQDDKDMGKSPVLLELNKDEKVDIVVRREGYKTKDLSVDGSEEKVAVSLEKDGRTGPRPSGNPNPRPKGSNGTKTPKPKGSSEEIYIPWK